ncbi:MAG: 4-hydroxy-3-methylbut-2-enyl diphosphate reductase [Mycobacteriales bacterium]
MARSAPALQIWADACAPRTVRLAGPRSFCAGVERAIAIVDAAVTRYGAPVYVRKQIVHNIHVVRDLQARGAIFVEAVDGVPDGSVLVFSAHGVSPQVRAEATARNLTVVDATCPLVAKVHAEARRYAGRGDTVVLIGHRGHEEVEGTLGEAPERTVLVESVEDVGALDLLAAARVSYLMQTTLAVDESRDIVDALRARFPALRGPSSDDICYATTNRQAAVAEVAAYSDIVLVVGSTNSSNSRRLVELASRECGRAYLVDDETDIRPGWLTGRRNVGITAGASAPPALVERVVTALSGLGPVERVEHTVVTESVEFSLPKELTT